MSRNRPYLATVLLPMPRRASLVLVILSALLVLACGDVRTSPDLEATPTPEATAVTPRVLVTPAPTPAPDVVDVVFCERIADGVVTFERCPLGTQGNGFAARLHVTDVARFPMGTVVPTCLQQEGDEFRLILDRPCAYSGLMKDGFRPVPPVTERIPWCTRDNVFDDPPPPLCVMPEGLGAARLMTGSDAAAAMTSLTICTVTLTAYGELRELYEPVIAALRAFRDGRGSLAALDDVSEPLFEYEFDERVERSSKPEEFRGVREWHEEIMDALDPVLDGDRTALDLALETIEEAHHFFGLGRGCGG